jgi:hypothetical protein
MRNKTKVRKIINLLIQVLILIVTYLFIYKQVFLKTDIQGIIRMINNDLAKPGFSHSLMIVIILMVINWGLEALKWKLLIGKVEKVGFFRSFQAVLTGASISSFTPNRVGEYFGRVFILREASHIEGILITILGSMSQLLVTVLTGTIALLAFIPGYLPGSFLADRYIYYALFTLVLALDILLVGLFFNVSVLSVLKEKILRNGLKRLRKFFRIFAFFHNREMATVMVLSFSRYVVFSTQFYLLLRMFEVPVPYLQAIILIPLIYLIMAVIPTIALTELGIRGSVAIYFFGLYLAAAQTNPEQYNLGILSASTLLWLINLGIPALVGTAFIFRLQFFRRND